MKKIENRIKKDIQSKIYNYFFEEYEDVETAKISSFEIVEKIFDIIDNIDNSIKINDIKSLSQQAHTIKHLLLYADLDDISDMYQQLEEEARKGELNNELYYKIREEFLKL